jgi:hypothetical protein
MKLDFPVLSDPELKAIDLYGVRHAGAGFGETADTARPAVYIIDRRGTIRYRNLLTTGASARAPSSCWRNSPLFPDRGGLSRLYSAAAGANLPAARPNRAINAGAIAPKTIPTARLPRASAIGTAVPSGTFRASQCT